MGFLKRHKVLENGHDDRRLRADVMELEPISQKIGILLLRSGSIEASRRVEHDKRIRDMREKEYPQLKGVTYLDYAGTALPSKKLTNAFAKATQSQLLSNPHSAGLDRPNTSQLLVDQTREKVLRMFNAHPQHFDVVFVANATAGIKLVAEAFSGHAGGFEYYYHRNAHTSLVGVRELARSSQCFDRDDEAEDWLTRQEETKESDAGTPKLFAYPAQSNMNGCRLPLTWSRLLRSNPSHQNAYCLLDVAALVSTSPFSLEDYESAPDFTVLSFYKIFGFPDLGALIVRKPASDVFERRQYFGGGTTEMITCLENPWFARKEKSLSARIEDGSLPIRNILALNLAIDAHQELYGGIKQVSLHTSWLAENLYSRLTSLKHWNGLPLCVVYKDVASTYGDPKTQGATVAFNVRRSDGIWIGSSTVGRIATEGGLYLRTGSLCNPAGMARALGLTDNEVQQAFFSGFRCGQEYDIRNGIPMGMVRVSLGAMSTLHDVDIFIKFMMECFVERKPGCKPSAKDWTRLRRASHASERCARKISTREFKEAVPSSGENGNLRFQDRLKDGVKRALCMPS